MDCDSSPVLCRLQARHILADASGFSLAGSVAIGFVVLLAESGDAAGFRNVQASGITQSRAKFGLASEKRHAITEIARAIRFKPQAAAAFRAGVTVARNVGGQQGLAVPQAL